ncbi:MAG: YdcF family protein [Gammaproteobacteria bacterium]|nr:YdcF family protein [Gammaproteobacteria bacterium]
MAIQTIVQWVIDPAFLVFSLALIIAWRTSRSALGVAVWVLPFYLLTTSAGPALVRSAWQVDDTVRPQATYAVVAPLGGAASENRLRMPDLLPVRDDASLFFTERVARVVAAVRFVKTGQAQKLYYPEVLVHEFSETDLVRRYALSRGLGADEFVVYAPTEHTHEEAAKLKQRLVADAVEGQLLVITSELHMRRALGMFRRQGLDPDVLSVNRRINPLGLADFVPSFNGMHEVGHVIYELVAYFSYRVLGKI